MKVDEQFSAGLNSAQPAPFTNKASANTNLQLHKTYNKVFLFGHKINILLTELSWSVWENLNLGQKYRPHCVRSVLTTSVKILPYRPPGPLITALVFHVCYNHNGHKSQIFSLTLLTYWEQRYTVVRENIPVFLEKVMIWIQFIVSIIIILL